MLKINFHPEVCFEHVQSKGCLAVVKAVFDVVYWIADSAVIWDFFFFFNVDSFEFNEVFC